MDEALIYWVLRRFGKQRGYILTPDEWKKLIPYSEKVMIKKYEAWQKELRQEEGPEEPQTD